VKYTDEDDSQFYTQLGALTTGEITRTLKEWQEASAIEKMFADEEAWQ